MDSSLVPLFLLPVLAGFKFNNEWEVTRYKVAREDGHRLYFKAALSGFFIALSIFLLLCFLAFFCSCFDPLINRLVSSATPAASVLPMLLLIALASSPLVAWPLARLLNLFITDTNAYFSRALEHDEFEEILVTAVAQASMLMVSMSSGKVYVGFVYTTGDIISNERKYLGIIPVSSGYRNREHQIIFTTFYTRVQQATNAQTTAASDSLDAFKVVIPRLEIQSIRLFSESIYERFQSSEDSKE